jgi:NAD(P)-dependent dehydrogenase (short-subunit alcohol dehydrogenase family)
LKASLAHKTVVVLGGTSGIGLATAKAAQGEDARVIVTGRSRERLTAAQAKLGSGARTVALDVADEAGTRALFQEIDRVDHIFITAGSVALDARLAPDSASLRPALDVRFWGAFNAAKYGAAKMNEGGSITFMSGTTARRPLRGAAVATASCGAVEAFARALAVDLAPIRVNTLQPGYVDTPMLDELLGEAHAKIKAEAGARLPVKRIGRPEELADAVLFLMKNGYVNGITLTVDGGGLLVG